MEFDGHIIGTSFASGDRIVAGRWLRSPFGAFADVMWCRPDGWRVLLAPDVPVRDFLTRHYAFDESRIEPTLVERCDDGTIEIAAGPLHVALEPEAPSIASWLLALRPRRLRMSTRWIGLEDRLLRPLVRRVFGAGAVRTVGVTAAGAREGYAIHDYRGARAVGRIDGVDLGPATPGPPARFGFSEAPAKPAVVRVTSMFQPAETTGGFGGWQP
jgi:hypothetical protein